MRKDEIMDIALSDCIEKVLEDDSIEAVYIYGSYVNGYYREDSDIDVVALTSQSSKNKPTKMPPNISAHMIHPSTFQTFKMGCPYTHLRMVPVYNTDRVREISDRIKSELVRRELIRFRQAGVEEFDVLEPLKNYLLGYAVKRPWRMKPIKRIFASSESRRILSEEYGRVLNLLEQRGMVGQRGDKFRINPYFVFDEEVEKCKDDFLFKVKNSYCGWHYLRNVSAMIDFRRRRI